ncbi:MAG: tRNA threonylcarbamoyladenosine dehydratase [Clostridium sp.]|nr:tRNA threonylcarbamoyladenosine dehydratase [Clostridium sp.]
MELEDEILDRARRLMGPEAMARMAGMRVILFGVGGVGSWCAESLVRSGVGHLTIVDNDCVTPSNLNRQMMATVATIGRPKVEALRERLLEIVPTADIDARREEFSGATAASFDLDSYDCIIDAIDSLAAKVALIDLATSLQSRPLFLSSMGAALKMDPTRVRVAEFRKVTGCPLARALRQRFKKMGHWPRRKFLCVYSDELLANLGALSEDATADAWSSRRASVNGSLMHMTAIFGLTLAGLAIERLSRP